MDIYIQTENLVDRISYSVTAVYGRQGNFIEDRRLVWGLFFFSSPADLNTVSTVSNEWPSEHWGPSSQWFYSRHWSCDPNSSFPSLTLPADIRQYVDQYKCVSMCIYVFLYSGSIFHEKKNLKTTSVNDLLIPLFTWAISLRVRWTSGCSKFEIKIIPLVGSYQMKRVCRLRGWWENYTSIWNWTASAWELEIRTVPSLHTDGANKILVWLSYGEFGSLENVSFCTAIMLQCKINPHMLLIRGERKGNWKGGGEIQEIEKGKGWKSGIQKRKTKTQGKDGKGEGKRENLNKIIG